MGCIYIYIYILIELSRQGLLRVRFPGSKFGAEGLEFRV